MLQGPGDKPVVLHTFHSRSGKWRRNTSEEAYGPLPSQPPIIYNESSINVAVCPLIKLIIKL